MRLSSPPSDTAERALALASVLQGDLTARSEDLAEDLSSSRVTIPDSPPSRVLRQLRAWHADVPEPGRWRHWVVSVDTIGRIRLPAAARPGSDEATTVLTVSRGSSLVLQRAGAGAPRHLDHRGRLTLPGWLRRLVGPDGEVLVSASVPDAATVVVAPATVLDVLVDQVAAGVA